ncbi:MAG: pilus (MSHA type) biogenesis protein MshL [Burkholderiales bacterium]
MKKFVVILATMLTACAHTGRGVPTEQRIESALKEAAAARTSNAEAINQALLPPLVVEMPKSEGKTAEQRFDIAVNNAPASEVFAAITSGSAWSIVVHPSIKESIALQLKNVTVFEALDTVREMYGYEYSVHGSRILIQPVGLQTRVYQLNYLMSQRDGRSETKVSSSALANDSSTDPASGKSTATNARNTESSRVTTTNNNDFWGDVAVSVKSIVGTEAGRSVMVNSQAGVLVVRAMPSELRAVNDFLRTMQRVVARQVMLEAKIIEVQLNDGAASGVNWAAFGAGNNHRAAGGVISPGAALSPNGTLNGFTGRGADAAPLANSDFIANPALPGAIALGSGAPGSILGLAFQTKNFAALLSFLETQGDLHVLSSPRIATLNNQKAVLKVGTDEFFVTGVTNNQTTSTLGTTNSPTIKLQPFFSGIALDVTPQIDETGHIILHVHPSVSTVVEKSKNIDLGLSGGTFRLPLATSSINESDTVVRVSDGNIVAIGGLMRETSVRQRSGIPGLSDIPMAGQLFKSRSSATTKSELVILIKPTVIMADEDWKKDARNTDDRIGELERAAASRPAR